MVTKRKLRMDVGRTREEQKYRNTLAASLKKLRSTWNETWINLAKTLLESEQQTDKYKTSIWLKRIDKNNIDYIIKHWNLKFLIKNLDKVKWFSHKEIAYKLIENWWWWRVAVYLDKFGWINHKEIAKKLIDDWKWWYVVDNLRKFEWLDKEIGIKLIEDWYWCVVLQNLNKFKWLERLDYKDSVIKNFVLWCNRYYEFGIILNYLDKIDWLNLNAAKSLFNKVDYLEDKLWERKNAKSTGDFYMDLESSIWNMHDSIKFGKYPKKLVKWIMDNFENFDNSSRVWFAKILYEWRFLQKYLDKFSPSEQKEIALDLISDGKWGFVIKYIDKFQWLDEEVAKKLNEKWYWKYISKYLKNFWLTR